MSDLCPVCGDGTLRVVAANRINWTAVCDICGERVDLDDDLQIVRDYEAPSDSIFKAWLYLLLIAAALEVLT